MASLWLCALSFLGESTRNVPIWTVAIWKWKQVQRKGKVCHWYCHTQHTYVLNGLDKKHEYENEASDWEKLLKDRMFYHRIHCLQFVQTHTDRRKKERRESIDTQSGRHLFTMQTTQRRKQWKHVDDVILLKMRSDYTHSCFVREKRTWASTYHMDVMSFHSIPLLLYLNERYHDQCSSNTFHRQ